MSVDQLIAECRADGAKRAYFRKFKCDRHEPAQFIEQLASSRVVGTRYTPFSGDYCVRLEEKASVSTLRLSLPRLLAVESELRARETKNGGLSAREKNVQNFVRFGLRQVYKREAPELDVSRVKKDKLHLLGNTISAFRSRAGRSVYPPQNTLVRQARKLVKACSR